MNYDVYHFSKKELVRYLCLYLCITGAVAYLFYDSFICTFILIPFIFPFLKYVKNKKIVIRKQTIVHQFEDLTEAVSTALRSGFSIENSFREANKDMEKLHGKDSLIYRETELIISRLENGETIEKGLMEFAKRTKVEDIQDFAELFQAAKRSGGNYISILGRIVEIMREKEDMEAEIITTLAGKHLEQRVISVVPIVIIVYLRVSTGSFMSSLYHNIIGIVCMTICLGLYISSYLLSEKISNIEV